MRSAPGNSCRHVHTATARTCVNEGCQQARQQPHMVCVCCSWSGLA
jgi:hypothetical protein